MEDVTFLKSDRILHIYFQLAQGEAATKKELAQQFHVTERSIQRDLGVLRCFLEELGTMQEIVCDKVSHKYFRTVRYRR